MKPLVQILSPEKENNKDNEIKLKINLDKLINGYIKEIDEKSINNHLDIYNISIFKKKENNNKEKAENENLKKKFSFEVITDKDWLEEEDIFFVMRNMHEKFKLINKKNYNLQIEENKLEIKKIFNKIISYAQRTQNNCDTEENENDWDILGENNPEFEEIFENNKELKNVK